jgi:hypothetical protein
MKNTLFILVATAFVAGTIVTGCQWLDKRAETSKEVVLDAQENVQIAKQELKNAIEQFKKESEATIAINEKNMAAFKVKIEDENGANKAAYEKKLADLEQKNKELKVKLADYKEDGNEHWNSFKAEFNHDMNELGSAFSDLTVNNIN